MGQLAKQRAKPEHKEYKSDERERVWEEAAGTGRAWKLALFLAQGLRSGGGGCFWSLMATETGRPQAAQGEMGCPDGGGRGVG